MKNLFSVESIEDVGFEDLFNLDDIQRLQDDFSEATGVASLITRPDGMPLTKPSNFTRFCKIIRSTRKGCANCAKSDAFIGRLCFDGPTVRPCLSAGLRDAGVAISVGEKHIANWLIGQVRDDGQAEEDIRAYAREIGADAEELATAFRDVPTMQKKRFESIARMLFTLATQLSDLACRNVEQERFIASQERAQRLLEVQQTIADIVATSCSEVEIFDMTRRELAQVMESENLVIAKLDETTRMLSTQSHLSGDKKEYIERWSAENSLSGLVVKSKKAMRFSKSEIVRLTGENVISRVGVIPETWIGVPLQNSKNIFGAIFLQSYDNPLAYGDWCMDILQAAANQLSVYLDKKHAETALRENEQLFRTFFEQHSVGFVIVQPGGDWRRFNDKFCEITGHSREELKNMTWRDITPKEDIEREIPYIKALRSGETSSYTFEKQYIRRDGSRIDVELSTRLLRNDDGSPKYFISLVQDISARKRSAREILRHQEAIIGSMAILAEHRDYGTGEHIRRTKAYVRRLLELSGGDRFYPPEHLDLLSQAAILHDIGKVGVPDGILLKPGKLTAGEFETVKRHTVIGGEVLAAASRILGDAPFISYARQIIEFHHEKWDGSGYPHGLKGEDIPFIARIMAIADVYDALVSERPYKDPVSHEEAVAIIAEGAGSHFDPGLVEVFLQCHAEFEAISRTGG